MANLLGYPTWAHFATATRMSGSPERIYEFLGPLREKALESATSDLEALVALKRDHLSGMGVAVTEPVKIDACVMSPHFVFNHVKCTCIPSHNPLPPGHASITFISL
jgi:hypothetical protein